MLEVSNVVGLDRLADWFRTAAFTPRGHYEQADPMAGTGRLADWIECSCLFGSDGVVSKTDAIDELADAGVLEDENGDSPHELAEPIIDEVFNEISRRAALMAANNAFPYSVDGSVLRRTVTTWTEASSYGFLLLATMGQLAQWLRTEATSHHEVGHLFEDLVRHSSEGLFGTPSLILETSRKGNDRLSRRVERILADFRRDTKSAIDSAPRRVRDGGLDVVSRFCDQAVDFRPGSAHLLVQCATGSDWHRKLGHPVLEKWREWVEWRGPIYKAFAVPFMFADDARLHDASRDASWALFLDRSRIIHGLSRAGSVPAGLDSATKTWCAKRLPALRKRGL